MGDLRPVEQLLLLVAYARRHDGARVDDAARALGLTAREVHALVDRLVMCGKPPFSPADLIDIWIEHPGRIRVQLDQSLGRPLGLTRTEALALSIALRALGDSDAPPYQALATAALDKLRATLAAPTATALDDALGRIAIAADDHGTRARFEALRRGLEERRKVVMTYFSAGRGDLAERRVAPYALVQRRGAWYCVAHDDLHGGIRIFKLERVRDAALTDEPFDLPPGFDAAAYQGALHGEPRGQATVLFRPPAARRILEDHPEAREQPGGSALLEVSLHEPDWLAAWVMTFAGDAEVLAPADLRAAVAERCRALLQLCGEPATPA